MVSAHTSTPQRDMPSHNKTAAFQPKEDATIGVICVAIALPT